MVQQLEGLLLEAISVDLLVDKLIKWTTQELQLRRS